MSMFKEFLKESEPKGDTVMLSVSKGTNQKVKDYLKQNGIQSKVINKLGDVNDVQFVGPKDKLEALIDLHFPQQVSSKKHIEQFADWFEGF